MGSEAGCVFQSIYDLVLGSVCVHNTANHMSERARCKATIIKLSFICLEEEQKQNLMREEKKTLKKKNNEGEAIKKNSRHIFKKV